PTYSLALVFFFFSSRRRHTRCLRDWSSDVCSSDLPPARPCPPPARRPRAAGRASCCRAAGGRRRRPELRRPRPPLRTPPRWACQIGRASCRERVEMSGGGGGRKKIENKGRRGKVGE